MLPAESRARFLGSLTEAEASALLFDWEFWARPEQLEPDDPDWRVWMMLAGRGFGKTRSGAEWVRDQITNHGRRNVALVGPTAADTRDVMVEGISGILAVSPPWAKPKYEPSNRKVTWPNGAECHLYSAEEPDRLRGPNHDGAWADELAAWKYIEETWDNLEFGLRVGDNPRVVVTTTPKPKAKLREILKDRDTRFVTGSTFANEANLAPSFIKRLKRKYEGTRTGRQELYAELLEEAEGSLWKRSWFEEPGFYVPAPPPMLRVVVAIDPQAGEADNEAAAETGIVVAGYGVDRKGYVLSDLSARLGPNDWARVACEARKLHKGDRIVAEINNGGAMVGATVRTVEKNVPFKAVSASRSKQARAEPISALYEQHRVHHCGPFPALEDQCCNWEPMSGAASPDRLDALVWALTDLMMTGDQINFVPPIRVGRPEQKGFNAPLR